MTTCWRRRSGWTFPSSRTRDRAAPAGAHPYRRELYRAGRAPAAILLPWHARCTSTCSRCSSGSEIALDTRAPILPQSSRLVRLCAPESTDCVAAAQQCERNPTRASLAAPSTGAAARRMRRRPSRVPAIFVTPARGMTLTTRETPSGVSRSHSPLVSGGRVGLRLRQAAGGGAGSSLRARAVPARARTRACCAARRSSTRAWSPPRGA